MEPNPFFGWGKSRWFLQPGVGGALSDLAPHVFDMLNYFFDDFPIAVSAYGSTYLDSPVEEFCAFLLEYPRGRAGIGKISWLSSTVSESVNILGTAQNMFVSPNLLIKSNPIDIQEISLLRAASKSLLSMKLPNLAMFRDRRVDPYQRQIDSFIKRIQRNEKSDSDAINALSVLVTCDVAKRAIEERRRLEIPTIEQSQATPDQN